MDNSYTFYPPFPKADFGSRIKFSLIPMVFSHDACETPVYAGKNRRGGLIPLCKRRSQLSRESDVRGAKKPVLAASGRHVCE